MRAGSSQQEERYYKLLKRKTVLYGFTRPVLTLVTINRQHGHR